MNLKVVSVQLATSFIVVLMCVWIYVSVTDNRVNVSVINETGFQISNFQLTLEDQNCSVTLLPENEGVFCTFSSDRENQLSILGRINNEAYLLENFGEAMPGKTSRNTIKLLPGNKIELTSKQIIL